MVKRKDIKNTPIGKYVYIFLRHVKGLGQSDVTIYTYEGVLNYMAVKLNGITEVNDIVDVKGYMLENLLHEKGNISPKTMNYHITVIRLFFSYLQKAGYMEKNPSDVLRRIKVVKNDDELEQTLDLKAYTDKQIVQIMKAIEGEFAKRDMAILAMLTGTGLRASELCSLTVEAWVDRQNGHIYVLRKGGAYKWVAVASYVSRYIDTYLKERVGFHNIDPLFVTKTGKSITRQELYRIIKKHQSRVSLQSGIHIFRHTFLTGTSKVSNDKIAQSLANHTTLVTTQKYIHSTNDERLAAVNGTSWAERMVLKG